MKNLIIVSFLICLLTGCNAAMNNLQKHINDLVASPDRISEKENADKLNSYSIDNNVSYQLSMVNSENSQTINIEDLQDNIAVKINVTISVHDSQESVWVPLDNSNIYIFLRE